MERIDIYNLIIIMILSTAVIMMGWMIQERTYACEKCANQIMYGERSSLYDFDNEHNTKVNGIYYSQGYYCVWTKDRTEKDINKTDVHELCHHFVYMDREHFCGDDIE